VSLDEAQLRAVVDAVLARLQPAGAALPQLGGGRQLGVYRTIDQAVDAAREAHRQLAGMSLERRREMVANIRRVACDQVQDLARMAVEETGLGRQEDKVAKNMLVATKTPGPEHLQSISYTGDHGLTLVERAPYGVIAAITPCTNPSETLICNGIGMLSGGNGVVFNPHPMATHTSRYTIDMMNRAVVAAGGPESVFCCVESPSLDSATELMHHRGINLLVVTGGGGVVQAALRAGRKCIAAGPGNPPVVVDATADIKAAGTGIVRGASFDNNVICTDEKEVFVVDRVADSLMSEMEAAGGYRLRGRDIDRLVKLTFPDGEHIDRTLVGKCASHYLQALDLPFTGDPRLIFAEVPSDHPFVQHEMLMPIIGVSRVRDVNTAIELAVDAEHGYRHTASMYSKDLDALHRMAVSFDGSIFVKNAPNYAGLGFGGEGYTSFTIASPTGEGLTTCRDFTRVRRCTLAGYFRIV
jgi:acyl-CoA reductase-like NAD-dependent aldehyde dehydrogenase